MRQTTLPAHAAHAAHTLAPAPLLLFSLALAFVFALALAPRITAAQITLHPTDPSAAPVTVQSADISTEITGRLAVTTFDLVFANPNNNELEGMFEFPLRDGQRVVRFALDIDDALREAVPVEKERGRVVFEEIERRRVDPGLLEQTAGNNYRARIYPIPANGTRRVVIAYQEDLAVSPEGVVPRYRLALDFPNVLQTFSLAAKVFSAPAVKPARTSTTLALELPAWDKGRMLQVKKENFTARGVFEFELQRTSASDPGPAVLTETFNGREYFRAEAPVPLPAMVPLPRTLPKCVGILWDASGSGSERDHEREFALLDAWFKRVPRPEIEVKLVCLRDRAAAPVVFKVRNGDWSGLRAALEKTFYDGATSFDGLADDASVDEWLLFSDGLVNFGATQTLDTLPLRAVVHTINASARSAPAYLRGLAARSGSGAGGEFVDLMTLATNTAAHRLRAQHLRIIALEHDPEAVAQVFPVAGANFDARAPLIVSGILRKPAATIRVKIGWPNGTVVKTVNIPLKSGEGASTLVARAWAVAKIEHLASAPGDNSDEIRRASREFRIVTQDTSLIVLETIEDYIQYGIEPPAEERELRDEWLSRRRANDEWLAYLRDNAAAFGRINEPHIERIVRLFNKRVAWWETDFPKDAPPKSGINPLEQPASTDAISEGTTESATDSQAGTSHLLITRDNTSGITVFTAVNFVNDLGDTTVEEKLSRAGSTDSSGPVKRFATREIPAGASAGTGAPAAEPQSPAVAPQPPATPRPAAPPQAQPNAVATANTTPEPRLSTPLRDTAASMSPFTHEFLTDVGVTTIDELFGNPPRWRPDPPYLVQLRRAPKEKRFEVYLKERAARANEPGFYLDAANYFLDTAKDAPAAIQILSNLAELGLEDAALLRALGQRLVQAERADLALPVFERVLKIRGEEPQSRHDLAHVCAKLGHHQRAVDLLWEVVNRPWDERFPDIELIALVELNAIVATCGQKLDTSKIDARLLKNLPVGLRVVLTWNTNHEDHLISLIVEDPNGEEAPVKSWEPKLLTYQGGRMSKDSDSLGPQEFLLRHPKPGKYTVKIDYHIGLLKTTSAPVTAQVRIITDFGTPQEKEKLETVWLVWKWDTLEIGSIEIEKP